jgi:hypothetical protein
MPWRVDRRSPAQRKAVDLLIGASLASIPVFAGLDWVLERAIGERTGILVSILLVASPLAGIYRFSVGGASPRRAARDGLILGLLVVALFWYWFINPIPEVWRQT